MIVPLYLLKQIIDSGVKFENVKGIDNYCDWFKAGFALTASGLGLWLLRR